MRNWLKLIFISPKFLFIHIFWIPQPQKKVLLVIFFGLCSKMRNRAYLSTKVSKIFFVMKTREGAYLPYLSIYKFLTLAFINFLLWKRGLLVSVIFSCLVILSIVKLGTSFQSLRTARHLGEVFLDCCRPITLLLI